MAFPRAALWTWNEEGAPVAPQPAHLHHHSLRGRRASIEEGDAEAPSSRDEYLALIRAAAGSAAAARLAEITALESSTDGDDDRDGVSALRDSPAAPAGSPGHRATPRHRRRRLSLSARASPAPPPVASRLDEVSSTSSGTEDLDPADAAERAAASLCGGDARREFFAVYSRNKPNRPPSARSAYLTSCSEQQLAPIPVLELSRRHARPTRPETGGGAAAAAGASPLTKRAERAEERERAEEGGGEDGGVDVNLNHYYLGAKRGLAVASALQNSALRLGNVSLVGAGLSDRAAAALVRSLTGVRELDLSENATGPKTCQALADLVRAPGGQLKSLRLADNRVGDTAAAPLLRAIAGLDSPLRELDLSGNRLRSEDLLAGVLGAASTLRLAWNHCSAALTSAIAAAPVTDLDLSHCSLGSSADAVGALLAAVAANDTLTALDLSHNALSEQASFALAAALQGNERLEKVMLERNALGPATAPGVVRLLMRGGLELGLAGCSFDSGGGGGVVDLGDCDGAHQLRLDRWYDVAVLRAMFAAAQRGEAVLQRVTLGGHRYEAAEPPGPEVTTGVMALTFEARAHGGAPPAVGRAALPPTVRALRTLDTRPRRCLATALAQTASVGRDGWRTIFSHSAMEDGRLEATRLAADVAVALGERREEELLRLDEQGRTHVEGLGVLTEAETAELQTGVGGWSSFRPTNPTGHYSLSLAKASDRAILRELVLRNRQSHALLAQTLRHPPSCFRNVAWGLAPSPIDLAAAEPLPREGRVAFDFAPAAPQASPPTARDDQLSLPGLQEALADLVLSDEQAAALLQQVGGQAPASVRPAALNAAMTMCGRVSGGLRAAALAELTPAERVTLRHHLGAHNVPVLPALAAAEEGVEVVRVEFSAP